jgi:hypothetical protein
MKLKKNKKKLKTNAIVIDKKGLVSWVRKAQNS